MHGLNFEVYMGQDFENLKLVHGNVLNFSDIYLPLKGYSCKISKQNALLLATL